MSKSVIFALISMVFAGITAVIAKMGLTGISAELGMTVRTCFVFVLTLIVGLALTPAGQWRLLTWPNFAWLGLSGATTAASWLFYYKALKTGDVSTVALIDKGSLVVAVILAWWFLNEPINSRVMIGMLLILAGLIVIARK